MIRFYDLYPTDKRFAFLLSSGFCASLDEKTVHSTFYIGMGKDYRALNSGWRALVSKQGSELSPLFLVLQFTFVML